MVTGRTFNTIGKTSEQVGGSFPVWARVDRTFVAGGYIDVAGMGLKAGDLIPAGTMVKYNGPGKQVDVFTADAVSGAAEVVKVSVLSGCTADGNVGVSLNGTNVNIAVTTADDTAEAVAAKISAGTFTGWTAAQDGASVVFTKDEFGVCTAPVVNANATGVVAEAEVLVAGVDAGGGDFSEVNGLVWNDVLIPEGCISATCAVVRGGRIYADRVPNGGIPASVEAQLPMIEFVRES